jgi:Putative peptidoglycan binding domain
MTKTLTTTTLSAAVVGIVAVAAFAFAGVASAQTTNCNFTVNQKMGQRGGQIAQVQSYLGVSPASGFFGGLTKAAVMKFQSSNGVTPVSGYWGPVTRAAANAKCSGGNTGTTPVPTGNGVSVSSAAQPANSLAPKEATNVPFTNFTLTNTTGAAITVNGVTVTRTGLATDAAFAGVNLIEQGKGALGFSKTLNSNHQAVIGGTFVLAAGETKVLTVAANIDSSSLYSGEVASFAVTAINTAATVAGSLPVTGAQHTINKTLAVGDMTLSNGSLSPAAAVKRVGDTNYTFAAVKVTAGSPEDMRLKGIRWYQNGSASASDLANLMTVVDGVSYPVTVSSDGKYFTSNFGSGMVIAKGNSKEISIKGDIVSGTSRTAIFSIYDKQDVMATGELYQYGARFLAGSGFNFANTPAWAAQTATINGGGITLSKDVAVGDTNVGRNIESQTLGAFKVKVEGEPVNANGVTASFTGPTTTGSLKLVTLVNANGVVVAGPIDSVGNTITFSDSVTFPVGETTYFIKGKVDTAVANGSAYVVSVTGLSSPRGANSNQTVTPAGLTAIGQTMTVKAAAAILSMDSNPSAQTIATGIQQYTFAKVKVDAGNSGEDVRFNALRTNVVLGATTTITNLSSCELRDGTTAISQSINPSATAVTFTLNNAVTIAKGTQKLYSIVCNVSGSASAGHTYAFALTGTALDYTFTGVNSTNDATVTFSTLAGGTMTLASGATITLSKDSSTKTLQLAQDLGSMVELGVLKADATVDNVTLSEIGVTYTGSGSASDFISAVKVYDAAAPTVLLGSAGFSGTIATVTLSSVITKDTSKKFIIAAELTEIGTGKPGINGQLVTASIIGVKTAGTTIVSGTAAFADGVRIYDTVPVVTLEGVVTSGSTLVPQGSHLLASAKITADGDEDLVFNSTVGGVIKFKVSTNGVPTNFRLKTDDGQLNMTSTQCVFAATVVTCTFTLAADQILTVPANGNKIVKLYGDTSSFGANTSIQASLEDLAAGNFVFGVKKGLLEQGPFSEGVVVFRGNKVGTAFSKN